MVHHVSKRFRILFSSFVVLMLPSYSSYSQVQDTSNQLLPVMLDVKRVGTKEINIFSRNEQAYIPLLSIFDFLRIKATYSVGEGRIEGFYLSPDNPFSIDFPEGTASIGDTSLTFTRDAYEISADEVYLQLGVFDSLFHVKGNYNPRRFKVTITPPDELPVFTARVRQRARERALQRQVLPHPDYAVPRYRSLFEGGKLEWFLSARTQEQRIPQFSYRFRLGAQVLGGDGVLNIRGRNQRTTTINTVEGLIRFPIYETEYVRQVVVGNLLSESFFFQRVNGIEITNRPLARRLLFSDLDVSTTLPESTETEFYGRGYLNSFLFTAEESTYNFSAPLPYGIGDYEFRNYDRWGALQRQAFRVVVPNTLLPPGELQYSLMAGKLRNIPVNYSNFVIGRGLSVHSTVYAGMEYFSDEVTQRNVFPYIRGVFRLTKSVSSDLFFSPLGIAHTAVDVQFPSQVQLGLTFSKYHRDPFINPSGYINTFSISVQGPMIVNSTRILLGGTGIQTVSSYLRDRTLFLFASVNWLKARVGLEHVFKEENFSREYETALSSTRINTSILAPAQVIFSTGISFDHIEGQIQSIFLNAERYIYRNLFFQAQLQRNFRPSITFGQIRLNLALPYARFVTSGIRSEREGGFKSTAFEQLVSGSVTASSRTWDIITDYRRQRDRGMLLIRPYFDGNDNNLPDGDDQYLPDVKVTTQGRYLTKFTQAIPKGTLVGNVEPYQDYLASIDPQSLGNPYWIPKYDAISITAEPNKLKVVNYPILSGGSIQGSVMIIRGDDMLPAVGLTIKIRSVSDSVGFPAEQKAKFLKTTKTYSNGMYAFNRLHPGMYEISLDAEELQSLGLRTPILLKQVEIKVLPEGDAVEDINFMLQ